MASSSTPVTREQLFVARLPEIERAIRYVCARRGLRGADAEDFASTVKFRLIENDYEVLAKFEGRCSLSTFLTVVVTRLYLDFQVRRFGKWRSSAEARRLGPVATRLERLMQRDKLTRDEACGVLGSDPRVSESRDELYEISLRLPRRNPLREPVPGEVASTVPAASDVERSDRQALADRIFAVIRFALVRLPARERLFLRLHLVDGLTVAQVSRSLGLDQKACYKKRDQLYKSLRADLGSAGIGSADARELLSSLDWDAEFFDDIVSGETGGEEIGPCPSTSMVDSGLREGEW